MKQEVALPVTILVVVKSEILLNTVYVKTSNYSNHLPNIPVVFRMNTLQKRSPKVSSHSDFCASRCQKRLKSL